MSKKIKKYLIAFSYILLIGLLVFLVYEIVKERQSLKTGFTREKELQKRLDDEKNSSKFKLSDNVEITKADCLNSCQNFKNNSEDYSYCQNLCQKWLNEHK